MGCDIHSRAEVRVEGTWRQVGDVFDLDDWDRKHFGKEKGDEPFSLRDYGLFGFLANVRNYSESPVIAEPRGLPDDVDMDEETREEWADNWYHSASWLTLAELLAYDYDRAFWDRRIEKDGNGAARAEEGEGEHPTLRTFLGEWFFKRLDELAALGAPEAVRVVFWFDN